MSGRAGEPIDVTGVGSWPGTDQLHAQLRVADACGLSEPGVRWVPYLAETPERGPHASMVGRATAMLSDLPVELVAHGYRLTRRPTRSGGFARQTLLDDIDILGAAMPDYSGPLKLSVAGPLTLAASTWLPGSERVISDPAATRDLVASLAEGVCGVVQRLNRAVPGSQIIVQWDEPAAGAVIEGKVRSASGLRRYASIDRHLAGAWMSVGPQLVAETIGAGSWLHSCASNAWTLPLEEAVFEALLGDASLLDSADVESLASLLDRGLRYAMGLQVVSVTASATRVLRIAETVGAPPGGWIIAGACGMAGAASGVAQSAAKQLMAVGRECAEALS